MKRSIYFLISLICYSNSLFAQVGGQFNYEFLRLPVGARQYALGGLHVSNIGHNPFNAWDNPATLSDSANLRLALNTTSFYANVNNLSLATAYTFDEIGSFHAGFYQTNYGNMIETVDNGEVIGEFSARDLFFITGYARQEGPFRLGANLKVISTGLSNFSSSAFGIDLGGVYQPSDSGITVGLTFQNIGTSFTKVSNEDKGVLPFDVVAGFSYKLKYMPLRFSTTLHHLNRWDVVYDDPNSTLNGTNSFSNQEDSQNNNAIEKAFRHVIVGGELLFSKNLHFLFAYNHLRRRELRLKDAPGLSGYSMGILLHTGIFDFSFSRAWYGSTGGINSFDFLLNINRWVK